MIKPLAWATIFCLPSPHWTCTLRGPYYPYRNGWDMKPTNLSNVSKESEEKAQDFQKHEAKKKEKKEVGKIYLPFNTDIKLVGVELPDC